MERMLTFKDAPMFAKVMRDPDICKGVIESILGIEVERIDYQSPEEEASPHTISSAYARKTLPSA